MKTIQIIWANSHKQNCLEHFWQERVGINHEVPKALKTLGFGDIFLQVDNDLITTAWTDLFYFLQLRQRLGGDKSNGAKTVF